MASAVTAWGLISGWLGWQFRQRHGHYAPWIQQQLRWGIILLDFSISFGEAVIFNNSVFRR